MQQLLTKQSLPLAGWEKEGKKEKKEGGRMLEVTVERRRLGTEPNIMDLEAEKEMDTDTKWKGDERRVEYRRYTEGGGGW